MELTHVPLGMNNNHAQQNANGGSNNPRGGQNTVYSSSGATSWDQQSNLGRNDSNSHVVGFIYTLSNNGVPEFWPIKIGVNKIGKNSDNDIVLREASVSDYHAQINIKRLRNGHLVAGIKDIGSSNGLALNDEELDYELHNCKHNDIITVGLNYRLVLLLVDPIDYELGAANDFVEIMDNTQHDSVFTDATRTSSDSTNIGQANQSSFNIPNDDTISINGGPQGISGGYTQVM